ncbi:MAG: GNAT family N-acetyltransferase [Desulfatiglandaceae bacterium]
MKENTERYPEKFIAPEKIFSHIHRGDRIFIGTGCGAPRHLMQLFSDYARAHPKAVFDAELLHIWTLGVAPEPGGKGLGHCRRHSFFVADGNRDFVNRGDADYTPVFMSQVPELFHRKLVPVDVAMVQVSPPNEQGLVSLGISVDVTRAAAENAGIVIAQINAQMPRIHGDTFLRMEEIDFFIRQDEALPEYSPGLEDEIAMRIGNYVARIVQDGDTIQVGYGKVPNAVLGCLHDKKHLGIHTELFTDGLADLMRSGVADNTKKSVDPGIAVASFCMGRASTYEFLDDNPHVHFRSIDSTNNPLRIAAHQHMTAINSALQIDLTGQATAETIDRMFYSGIGGQTDFIRGTMLSASGKSILAIQSTARNGKVSRIVPFLGEGTGVTLNRGDVHYVVTEYGIAYLHGKSIRERAMELISIAHPDFRPWLVEQARESGLIYRDQIFIPGKGGEYPEELENYRTTKTGLEIFLRPIKITDEPLLKKFAYSLSEQSVYRRFFSTRVEMPHSFLQKLVAVDYTKNMAILAIVNPGDQEKIVGVGRYFINSSTHRAEVAFAVLDDYQNKGIGRELLAYLIYLGKKKGLLGFTAAVLAENEPMLHLFRVFEKKEYEMEKKLDSGTFRFDITFNEF